MAGKKRLEFLDLAISLVEPMPEGFIGTMANDAFERQLKRKNQLTKRLGIEGDIYLRLAEGARLVVRWFRVAPDIPVSNELQIRLAAVDKLPDDANLADMINAYTNRNDADLRFVEYGGGVALSAGDTVVGRILMGPWVAFMLEKPPKNAIRNCPVCLMPFYPERDTGRVCSNSCRVALKRYQDRGDDV